MTGSTWARRTIRTANWRLSGARRRLWLLPAALIAALSSLMGVDESELRVPPLADCHRQRPQLVVTVLDVSGSVIDHGGADPDGRSFTEARAIAEELAARPCTPDDRFAAVIFASRAVTLEPTSLRSLSIIDASLKRPPAHEIGIGTDLATALATAGGVASRFPQHDATVIVLSDMRADDGKTARETLRRLVHLHLHLHLHLVGLGEHDTSYDDAFVSVAELGNVERGEVAEELVRAINLSREGP